MKLLFSIIVIFFSFNLLGQNSFVHPRGIITPDDVTRIQKRIQVEPYRTWFEKIKTTTLTAEKALDESDPYQTTFLAQKQAQLYILTGKEEWAEKCRATLELVINDTVYFNDPISRGLTRATQLFGVAICYDFCFNAWNDAQRKLVAKKLFQTMLNTNANMGYSANYAMESNWNGVRWGSALLAALVYDDLEGKHKRNPALPFIWDIQKRLKDHIARNIFPGGWSAESLSYHGYNWSFVAPAIIANQNNSSSPSFQMENYAPHALHSMWAWSTATSSIAHPGGKGTQPDFSDDDPQSSYALAALALRLYPVNQIQAIKWMHDYLLDVDRIDDERGYLFYSICWYPDDIQAKNPSETGWKTFIDSTYGTAVWRNWFKNNDDIIVGFTAPLKRVSGHKGPDNLSFRIIGLGNIWVVGGGRTGEIAGQTNLFPHTPKEKERQPQKSVASTNFKTGQDGTTYWASAAGSCLGVDNHKRKIEVEFHEENAAVVKIKDSSDNGKIWRLNTPEFNKVKITKNGFELLAPNGSKMKVTVPVKQIKGEITVTKVRYGGSTTNHNRGIGFGDKYWPFSKAIDIPCTNNINVNIEFGR